MRRTTLTLACALALACSGRRADTAAPDLAPAATDDALAGLARGAVLLPGLDAVHRDVTTRSQRAQAYFDQGLALVYGFNHGEAARAFARAAELDPTCALCLWGVAFALGPNYNAPMLPGRARLAWDAITRAQRLAHDASPVEAALIAALTARVGGPDDLDPDDMQPLNEAYARAMRDVAARFPDDLDVQVLHAGALMNLRPWRLWTPAGEPGPDTLEILETLDAALARAPEHAGANHLYIHAIEASPWPERGVPAADRLGRLVPGAGHLVHMPAHIYARVGRWEDAAEANRRAIEADRHYLARVDPPGDYPMYVAHNHAFLAYAAAMQGGAGEALKAAHDAAAALPRELACAMPGMDLFTAAPLLVMVRFGLWDDVAAAPQPAKNDPIHRALWHHARGMALAAGGQVEDARAEAAAIRTLAAETPAERPAGQSRARHVLELAAEVVEARAAEIEGSPDAIARWELAVQLADRLAYDEPPDWFYPVRHYLGAALLDAGRPRDAEAVYEADLERNPENGWSLFGRWKALAAQGHRLAAAAAERDYIAAWRRADFELTRSAF